MNWKALQKKYPTFWASVYKSVVADLLLCMDAEDIQAFKEGNKRTRIDRIAHNASFCACYELNKM